MIVLQALIIALVDYKKRFLDVEIDWPGSVGDARVFENSYLGNIYVETLAALGTTPLATCADMEEDIPAFILGDSAYRNTRHLVTTYKVTECDADRSVRHLNFILSKARYKVEHAFGLLKGRFRIFDKPLKSGSEDLLFTIHLIASICVLHNFLIDTNDAVPETDVLLGKVAEQLQNLTAQDGDAESNEQEGIISADDVEQDINGRQNNIQDATRDSLLRRMKWMDES